MTDEVQTENTKEETEQAGKPIEQMTVKELRDLAKEVPGATGVHAMKKDELVALVMESKGKKEEAPAKKKKAKEKKASLTVKDIKQKISGLKEEKKKAQETKDRDKIESLRRRINRLKKQSRKAAQA